MLYIPIPGIGQPDLSVPELNMAHYIDRNYLPGVMWQDTGSRGYTNYDSVNNYRCFWSNRRYNTS